MPPPNNKNSTGTVIAKRTNPFLGRWRVVAMEQWDRDYIDMVVPGYIAFEKDNLGHFQFGTVQGELDCPVEAQGAASRVEFS